MKKTKQKFGEMRESREIKNRNEMNIDTEEIALLVENGKLIFELLWQLLFKITTTASCRGARL